MDPEIKQRFNDAILAEAFRRFDIDPAQAEMLDGFESFIYSFTRAGSKYILRIGHDSRRSEALIRGEVEWMNKLAAGGAGVARAVESARGNLVEPLPDGLGGSFLGTAFEHAPGAGLRMSQWDIPFIESYGRLLGRMHALSRNFRPRWPRPHWDDPLMLYSETMLPPAESIALDRYHTLMDHLLQLPRDNPAAYGMIHQDAHGGNFFVDSEGRITLFDFDDCVYSWYMNDIAIVLFYALTGEADPVQYTAYFMEPFLRGYRQENTLDPRWLAEVPHFLKLREIDLYAAIHRSFDVENLTDPWVSRYMSGRKQRIEQGLPYVDFDFTRLAGILAA